MDLLITERQFTALARISGLSQTSAGHKAMKMVLVYGTTGAAAAKECGLTQSYVSSQRAKMIGVYLSLPQRIALLNEALGK